MSIVFIGLKMMAYYSNLRVICSIIEAQIFLPRSRQFVPIFTTMPQQLFLFDNKPPNDAPPLLPEANEEVLLPVKPDADDNEIIASAEEETMNNDADGNNANPFAAIQQEQQEKIETMLLLPNKKRGRKSFEDMDKETILIDVPEDAALYQKQYYPTRVVAEWFGISPTQLRAWAIEFDILQPKKNGRGDRFFRPEDIQLLKLIYHLIRVRKFTVPGAKQYLKDNKKGLQTTVQLTESLRKFKQFLLELKAISG